MYYLNFIYKQLIVKNKNSGNLGLDESVRESNRGSCPSLPPSAIHIGINIRLLLESECLSGILAANGVFAKRRVRWLMHMQLAASSNFLGASLARPLPFFHFPSFPLVRRIKRCNARTLIYGEIGRAPCYAPAIVKLSPLLNFHELHALWIYDDSSEWIHIQRV